MTDRDWNFPRYEEPLHDVFPHLHAAQNAWLAQIESLESRQLLCAGLASAETPVPAESASVMTASLTSFTRQDDPDPEMWQRTGPAPAAIARCHVP